MMRWLLAFLLLVVYAAMAGFIGWITPLGFWKALILVTLAAHCSTEIAVIHMQRKK